MLDAIVGFLAIRVVKFSEVGKGIARHRHIPKWVKNAAERKRHEEAAAKKAQAQRAAAASKAAEEAKAAQAAQAAQARPKHNSAAQAPVPSLYPVPAPAPAPEPEPVASPRHVLVRISAVLEYVRRVIGARMRMGCEQE